MSKTYMQNLGVEEGKGQLVVEGKSLGLKNYHGCRSLGALFKYNCSVSTVPKTLKLFKFQNLAIFYLGGYQ